jgi:hypothetical protein
MTTSAKPPRSDPKAQKSAVVASAIYVLATVIAFAVLSTLSGGTARTVSYTEFRQMARTNEMRVVHGS